MARAFVLRTSQYLLLEFLVMLRLASLISLCRHRASFQAPEDGGDGRPCIVVFHCAEGGCVGGGDVRQFAIMLTEESLEAKSSCRFLPIPA